MVDYNHFVIGRAGMVMFEERIENVDKNSSSRYLIEEDRVVYVSEVSG